MGYQLLAAPWTINKASTLYYSVTLINFGYSIGIAKSQNHLKPRSQHIFKLLYNHNQKPEIKTKPASKTNTHVQFHIPISSLSEKPSAYSTTLN